MKEFAFITHETSFLSFTARLTTVQVIAFYGGQSPLHVSDPENWAVITLRNSKGNDNTIAEQDGTSASV